MGFDIEGARKAGYSDGEIADHLAQSAGFDAAGARKAGYSDADILKHLAGPGRSVGERVVSGVKSAASAVGDAYETAGNYRDTRFAKAMGSVAGIPRMAADAANWVGQKTGLPLKAMPIVGPAITAGSMLPTGEEASRFMLDRANARPGFAETNLNPVVDAGVEALFAGPVLGAGGKMGPAVNASAAMGSEGAGQVFEGSPLEPYARVAGGVVGGMVPFGVAKGAKVVGSLAEPFREAGRDKIVAKTLVDRATDAPGAIKRLDAYSPPVPGFEIAAGKASRDPGLMGIQEVAESNVPYMRGMYDRNNVTLTSRLDDAAAGLPPSSSSGEIIQKALRERYDTLDKTRAAKSGPLYDAARNSPTPVDPSGPWAVAAQASESTVGKPQSLMDTVKGYFESPKGPDPTTPKGLMAIREAVGDLQDDLSMGRYSKSLLRNVKTKIDDALAAVPEEKLARDTFATYSKPLEPFDPKKGNKVVADAIAKDQFNKDFLMPAEKVPSLFMRQGDLSAPMMQKFIAANGGNSASADAMRAYVLDDFRKAVKATVEDAMGNPRLTASGATRWLEKNKGAAANILSPDQMKALETVTAALKDQAVTIPGRTNSATFDRLATENILGALLSPKFADAPILHPVRKALGIAYGGANEAVMNRLFEVIQDPKVASALMKKANAGNVKMAEPILEQLAKGVAVSQSVGSRE